MPSTSRDVIRQPDRIRGQEFALQQLVKHVHDNTKIPGSTCTIFIDKLLNETVEALDADSSGPDTLKSLINKLTREYSLLPQSKALNL